MEENKTKKCKYCQSDIDSSAKVCPNCRKKQGIKGWQIALIVIAVLIVVFGLSGDSTNTEPNIQANDSAVTSTNVENKVTEVKVGENITTNTLKVSFIELNDNFTGYSQYASVKSGYKVIKATFEFENISSTDQYVSDWDFNCYADGYDCETFYSVDDNGFSATLSAGKKTKGNIYYEVPNNATDITLEYETDFWTDKKVIFRVK